MIQASTKPMEKQRFWSVSVGNVVSWLVIAVGFISWGKGVADRVDRNRDETVALKRSFDSWTQTGIPTTVAEHERRLANLESSTVSIKEMETDIKWIKRSLQNPK